MSPFIFMRCRFLRSVCPSCEPYLTVLIGWFNIVIQGNNPHWTISLYPLFPSFTDAAFFTGSARSYDPLGSLGSYPRSSCAPGAAAAASYSLSHSQMTNGNASTGKLKTGKEVEPECRGAGGQRIWEAEEQRKYGAVDVFAPVRLLRGEGEGKGDRWLVR